MGPTDTQRCLTHQMQAFIYGVGRGERVRVGIFTARVT